MNTRKKLTASATAALIGLSCSASNAAVILSLTSGDNPLIVEDNTTYVSTGTVGWGAVADGTTVSDDTQSTGLVMTVSTGNTGSTLHTQGADHVGTGTLNNGNGFTQGDIILITFNQDVTLNSLYFGHGGADVRSGGVVTPTLDSTALAAGNINPIKDPSGNLWLAEVVYDDATILSAGDTLSIELTTGASNALGLSGIEVEIVPEPSSTALLGLGGLALIMRRRK